MISKVLYDAKYEDSIDVYINFDETARSNAAAIFDKIENYCKDKGFINMVIDVNKLTNIHDKVTLANLYCHETTQKSYTCVEFVAKYCDDASKNKLKTIISSSISELQNLQEQL